MKIKKHISFLLCISVILSFSVLPSYASDSTKASTPAIINIAEEITGTIINCIAKLFNNIIGTDETAVPSATVNPPSWIEYKGEPIENPERTLTAETWVADEIAYESEKSYTTPFSDVDVELHLWGNGRLYKIPAFWDGGNVWKIRFVCPSAGVWYYKTVCTDEGNSSLNGRTGKVICSEYSGDHEIYKHGFITTNAGKKNFTYDDGTPFSGSEILIGVLVMKRLIWLKQSAKNVFHKALPYIRANRSEQNSISQTA